MSLKVVYPFGTLDRFKEIEMPKGKSTGEKDNGKFSHCEKRRLPSY